MSAEAQPRRSRQSAQPSKGDRRELALREAAEELLATGRFDDTPVAEIARGAGISRATFYFYFSSKEALLASVVDDAVTGFNARILAVLSPDRTSSPAAALRASVEAAADLWWEHRIVLCASVALGTMVPEVYERARVNIAAVREPTVALLMRHGTVPEAEEEREATELVTALILMTERNFYDLMRGEPSRADVDELADRLARIWLRSFGLEAQSR